MSDLGLSLAVLDSTNAGAGFVVDHIRACSHQVKSGMQGHKNLDTKSNCTALDSEAVVACIALDFITELE